ncbi:antirestriction protein ArdA [Paenibacillus chitinolyticus]|uniref:antirestriction protein ArdA n=1 Tax=Paenibacillus chitinolyticus TaxID=79263 RepID=UPI003D024502
MNIRIYVANLAAYNSGMLVGEWFDLPMDIDDLMDGIAEVCGGRNEHGNIRYEWAIHDYEAPFKVNEHDSVERINDWAELLDGANEDDSVIETILNNESDIEAGIGIVMNDEYRVYWDCEDMEDVAYAYIEETGLLSNIPDNIANYFDYEKFGRDMEIEGTFLRGRTDDYKYFHVEIIN